MLEMKTSRSFYNSASYQLVLSKLFAVRQIFNHGSENTSQYILVKNNFNC